MSDIKIFKMVNGSFTKLDGHSVSVEKSLQTLIENHLEVLLGITFLATEYVTGKTHAGRIDTLGLDENGSPVIIEYKRTLNENVINQGLYYLDWLLDHKAEFEMLVVKKHDQQLAGTIDWSAPRLLCIAGDFTKYDLHAVQQMDHAIELIRYRRYGDELLLFELVNATTNTPNSSPAKVTNIGTSKPATNSLNAGANVIDLFEALKSFASALGDEVQVKQLKRYYAFARLRNFACVYFLANAMIMTVNLDPDSIVLEKGFTRDLRGIGHWGTGDLEIRIGSNDDLERAKPLILKSFEAS